VRAGGPGRAVNLFGHSVVARAERADPCLALGAMLPDLTRMCGLRLARAGHAALEEGVRLHHRTDRAFHSAPSFGALLGAGARELRARGVVHGRALAAAHVGVELLLDGVLLDEEPSAAHYLDALRAAPDLIGSLELRGPSGPVRLRALVLRMLAQGPPRDYLDPGGVAVRVLRALGARPRHALSPAEEIPVREWLVQAAPLVRARAATLLDETRARLPRVVCAGR
jgi:hypothetical protein